MNHLLARGEDPKNIRILDIRAPTRSDLTQGPGKLVGFIKTDVTDQGSVIDGCTEPWPTEALQDADITVFCTVANIRFYEQHPALLPLSAKVNVVGPMNVIKGSIACGATILIYTSSGSIGVRKTEFLLAPWKPQPERFAQVLRDDADESTRPHSAFSSNYAFTKMAGEGRILAADKSPGLGGKILRTGALRPGCSIYGVGGDQVVEMCLKNPDFRLTWNSTTVQHLISVENCSLAHLCYEQRLIELANGTTPGNPDIGGRSFLVADAGPPVAYSDCHRVLGTLTDGEVKYRFLSPSLMLLLSHVIQWYYLTRYFLSQSPNVILRTTGSLLPKLSPLISSLQPPLWNVSNVHGILDSSNARARPEAGGLGYEPLSTSLEGLCQLVLDYQSGRVVDHAHISGGHMATTSGASIKPRPE